MTIPQQKLKASRVPLRGCFIIMIWEKGPKNRQATVQAEWEEQKRARCCPGVSPVCFRNILRKALVSW